MPLPLRGVLGSECLVPRVIYTVEGFEFAVINGVVPKNRRYYTEAQHLLPQCRAVPAGNLAGEGMHAEKQRGVLICRFRAVLCAA